MIGKIVTCTLLTGAVLAQTLEVLPEHLRPDPFGGVVKADGAVPAVRPASFRAARRGYVSFHLVARPGAGGSYELSIDSPLPVDIYREWFHPTRGDYYPDALIPAAAPYRGTMPDPDNRIDKQTAQAFWVDVWIPADARPGTHRLTATLRAGAAAATASVEIRVLDAVIPDDDVVLMDHNSYGSTFLADQYPKLAARHGDSFFTSDAFFGLIHAHHRIFHEHRGIYHQLGYGHGGKVAPEFAPTLEGSGRSKRIANWDLYDRHYGPLFDGSALRGGRRPARPIPYVYTPINPEWPASFLWWGEPGYETEFVNVVAEMERHFRAKGWTSTQFEMYFNHKKRYKAFPWDGDEVRFLGDDRYLKEYARLLRRAVPASSPVKFVFRSDSSWALEQQFTDLAGVIGLWVSSSGVLSWNREPLRKVLDRGDRVWHYSGPPPVTLPSAMITRFAMRAWVWGIHGYVHWLAVSPGADPWHRFGGGETALVYSGERFGIEGPIPSVRLKIQRNSLQDLALAGRGRGDAEIAAVTQRYNNTAPADWWNPRPALADMPPHEWSNADIDEAVRPAEQRLRKVDAGAWQRVREYVLDAAGRSK